ncbi:MAG: hypothetical protein JZU47_07820 [Prolixibacteraceae bacterium]|nr:hypothetical protein [Prolixibacteraceae bacterium]
MKKEIENLAKKTVADIASKPISRKEAIKKTGYMAVSAATMMLLLNNPAQAGRNSPTTSPVHSHRHSNHSNHQQVNTNKQNGSKDNGIWK